jgi:hypothetical protein
VKDVKIIIEGISEKDADETGGRIRDVSSGSIIAMNIDIKNIGLKRIDEDINDIIVETSLEGRKNGKRVQTKSGYFTLGTGDTEQIELSLEVPLNADEDTYDLIIEVTCEKDDGFETTEKIRYSLDIESDDSELKIDSLHINSDERCDGHISADIRMINVGKTNFNGFVRLSIPDIQAEEAYDFSMAADENIVTKNFEIAIPEGTARGDYEVIAKIDYGKKIVQESSSLEYAPCGSTISEKTDAVQKNR